MVDGLRRRRGLARSPHSRIIRATKLRPQGVSALFGKWNELERVQRENANLAGKLEERKEKLRILKESAVQQELEIRRKLKRLKKGETIYDVPDPEPEPETIK